MLPLRVSSTSGFSGIIVHPLANTAVNWCCEITIRCLDVCLSVCITPSLKQTDPYSVVTFNQLNPVNGNVVAVCTISQWWIRWVESDRIKWDEMGANHGAFWNFISRYGRVYDPPHRFKQVTGNKGLLSDLVLPSSISHSYFLVSSYEHNNQNDWSNVFFSQVWLYARAYTGEMIFIGCYRSRGFDILAQTLNNTISIGYYKSCDSGMTTKNLAFLSSL